MTLTDIQKIFNRAFWLSFSRIRVLFVFIVLGLCGLLSVFCRGLALEAGSWVAMSLAFLPIFLCSGILLATGIVVIRAYHDEVKKREVRLRSILKKSWELMIGTSYLTLPLLLGYLLLWIVLGVFHLLREIPTLGQFISVVLSFGPFLLILGSLVLSLFNLFLLFFVTPAIALHGSNRSKVAQLVLARLKFDIFGNLLLLLVAVLPLLIVIGFLWLSAHLTDTSLTHSNDTLLVVLQWFFIMLPFALLLAPAVTFFFNFAAEAHVLMVRRSKE